MKQKIFSLLVLVMTAVTASAVEPAYKITVGTNEHGTFAFKVNDVDATLDDNNELAVDEGDEITLIITPNTNWVVNAPSGEWHAVDAAARGHHRALDIDMNREITLTHEGTDANGIATYTFEMIRADAEISCTYLKELIVTADDKSIHFGENAPVYTATITGFIDGEDKSALSGTLTFACTYGVGSGVGKYTIIPSGYTSDKYDIIFVNGTLTVDKASYSVSFPVRNVNKRCDDEPFTITLNSSVSCQIKYRSSNTDVASVDENGKVTIHSAGKTTIYASVFIDYNYESEWDYYNLDVAEKELVNVDGTQAIWDGISYTVTIDEDVAPGAVIPEEICEAQLTYERMLDISGKTAVDIEGKGNYLYTVCLPFTPYFNAKFYTLTGYSDGTLQFSEISGHAQAYTPYLVSQDHNVAVKNVNTGYIGTGGSVSEESVVKFDGNPYTNKQDMSFCSNVLNGTVVDGYQLCGTLRGMTNADAAAAGAFILQTDGSWGAVKAGNEAVYIPPFRAYVVAASAQSARLTSSFGEGGATGIERIVTTDLDGTERWYDLNGRRIEKPTTKGVYIQNGKKTVIK